MLFDIAKKGTGNKGKVTGLLFTKMRLNQNATRIWGYLSIGLNIGNAMNKQHCTR